MSQLPFAAPIARSSMRRTRAALLALLASVGTGCGAADPTGADDARVVTVVVVPAAGTLEVGATRRLVAEARDSSGAVVAGVTVAWQSIDAAVATVGGDGTVRGVAPGTARIVATVQSRSDTASIGVTAASGGGGGPVVAECATPRAGWLFCDDFEQDRLGQWFEYNDEGGRFVRAAGAGVGGSQGMRARWAAGEVSAGDLSLAFGRTPSTYMRPVDAGTANHREIYWRYYLRNQPGWTGGAGWKHTRIIIFADASWAEALIAHVAGYQDDYLYLSGHSGTDAAGTLRTTRYNDFANFRSFGDVRGTTPLFNSANVGQWQCIEGHVRLNDAGQANGVFEFWRNDQLEARQAGLNMVGSYNAYGLNAIFLNNYHNSGSPQAQERTFDNIVVSTQRIGC